MQVNAATHSRRHPRRMDRLSWPTVLVLAALLSPAGGLCSDPTSERPPMPVEAYEALWGLDCEAHLSGLAEALRAGRDAAIGEGIQDLERCLWVHEAAVDGAPAVPHYRRLLELAQAFKAATGEGRASAREGLLQALESALAPN